MKIAEKPITYHEFLEIDFPENADLIYELLNGYIVKYNAPESKHQFISANLHLIIGSYVKEKKLGRVLYAPISVFLNEYNAPQPDLLFVSKKNESIIHDKGIVGVPDLIVEIISPGSIIRDRIEKKEIYEQAGVKEYWIVDPKYKSIEVYELSKEVYKLISSAEENGTIRSKVIKNFAINIETVFEP